MKITKYSNDSDLIEVIASEDDVMVFNRRWPGSRIPIQEYVFTLDKRSNFEVCDVAPDLPDGAESAALMGDAQEYGGASYKIHCEGKDDES